MSTKILLFIFAATILRSVAQGFNNEQEYDQQDLAFLFKTSGIEVFKFPFKSNGGAGLNIIIEEYSQGKLIKNHNVYKDIKPMMALLDEPETYNFPPLTDSVAQTLRFYVSTSKREVSIHAKTSKIEIQYNFESKRIKLKKTRAFDYIPEMISKKQPLFVFYGTRQKNLLSCPGDASVEAVTKMYEYVIVAYADLLTL